MSNLIRPLQNLYEQAHAQYRLGARSYHGAWHWDKVERNGMALCKLVKDADETVVRLFAILHDSQRENEDRDPEHGRRAARYVRKLYEEGQLSFLTKEQLETLEYACAEHNEGKVSSEPTVGVCWDSDRLDLSRVGIAPKAELLSTEAGKSHIWRI